MICFDISVLDVSDLLEILFKVLRLEFQNKIITNIFLKFSCQHETLIIGGIFNS